MNREPAPHNDAITPQIEPGGNPAVERASAADAPIAESSGMPPPDAPSVARSVRTRLAPRLFWPRARRATNAALAAGHIQRVATEDLLSPERLPALARQCLALLLVSGAGYLALDLAAMAARHVGVPLNAVSVVGLIAGSIVLYCAILPVHEAIHATVILALGGRPRFGLRLPLALYCTAPDHVFTRAGYVAVALAPLVALSAAGAAVTWLWPIAGAYLVLALAGNVAGAVGDLAAVAAMRRLPAGALIADTATGFAAYTLDDPG